MTLTIPLADGTTLTFEGTYEELIQVAEKFVDKHAAAIAVSSTPSSANHITQPKPNGSRRWTEQSVKKLGGLLYGEQAKVVKFLVDQGGTAIYKELAQHMGYDGQRLSGILSPITRNAQTATGDRLARLVDWRTRGDGEREYFIDPEALPLLQQSAQRP